MIIEFAIANIYLYNPYGFYIAYFLLHKNPLEKNENDYFIKCVAEINYYCLKRMYS